MKSEDFKTLLSAVCHEGAFGTDYRKVDSNSLKSYGFNVTHGGSFVFVWKIPADLKKISTYTVDKNLLYTEHHVGEYGLRCDYIPEGLSKPTKDILNQLKIARGLKVRSDFSDRVTPSVHHLLISDTQEQVPGISTAFFFTDFYYPKSSEIKKVKTLLSALADLGIGAYVCNKQQHMIIIGSYQDNRISPKQLADLLESNPTFKESFLEALQAAAATPSFIK